MEVMAMGRDFKHTLPMCLLFKIRNDLRYPKVGAGKTP